MVRRFFIWLAIRKMNRSSYRIDRRHYRGVFNAGFFAHLSNSKFWQTDNDPFLKAQRRKNRLIATLILLCLFGLTWITWEGFKAFEIF